MKSIIALLPMLVTLFATNSVAETIDGKILLENGNYFLSNGHEKVKIKVINDHYSRGYVGAEVRIDGEIEDKVVDVDVISMVSDGEFEKIYDWEKINDELYDN